MGIGVFGCIKNFKMSHSANLYRWKRFQPPKESHSRRKKKDDIQNWLEKVEAATDSAMRTAFDRKDSTRNNNYMRTRSDKVTDDDILQLVGDIHDNEAAHVEAKEIVTDWISDKIRYDFLDDKKDTYYGEDENAYDETGKLSAGIETATHEKWYEDSEVFLQRYLNPDQNQHRKDQCGKSEHSGNDVLGQVNVYDDDEGAVVNLLMKRMMEKPVIDSKDVKALKKTAGCGSPAKPKIRPRNPITTMDMRHKEVREARLRRQQEEEKKKLDRMIQKEAKLNAQRILREEELQKKLKKKQEEEAIQAEMARIRKEMFEQRKLEEKQRRQHEIEDAQESPEISCNHGKPEVSSHVPFTMMSDEKVKEEERLEKLSEIMNKRNTDNRRLLQSCFSTWCKLILQQRVKSGKAKALADWKCMQKAWVSWKSYAMNFRLERETVTHQANLRDMRIKEKRASELARGKLLRKTFLVWKVWVKTEQEHKEILTRQQRTKAKMQALLDAVATSNHQEDHAESASETKNVASSDPPVRGPMGRRKTASASHDKRTKHGVPKEAWQVTRKDVQTLTPQQMMRVADNPRHSPEPGRMRPVQLYDPYENRHKFQKELIDQQRALLQEQKRMIEDIQEQRRLAALQNEISGLKEQKKALETNRMPAIPKEAVSETSSDQKLSTRENPGSARSVSAKRHPIVERMEKRALERAERKKEIAELKRKREEEKRRKMEEEEERKLREEEEARKKEIRERREAKRQQLELEEEKLAAQRRLKELCLSADQHHAKSLMKFYGFLQWRRLVDSRREKLEVAKYHAQETLLRKALLEWQDITQRNKYERNVKADSFCKILTLRRSIRCWKRYGEMMEISEQKAVLHRNRILTKKYIKLWVDYTTDEKLNQWRLESRADQHNQKRQLKRVFNVLRSYRKLVKSEVERRQRIEDMRKKVTQLIPDFRYSQDSFISDNFDDAKNAD